MEIKKEKGEKFENNVGMTNFLPNSLAYCWILSRLIKENKLFFDFAAPKFATFKKNFVSLHQLPMEVSMCYGTLPRGGFLPSVVFYTNNPSLKKSLFLPFSYSQTSLIVAPTFNLATTAWRIKRSEAPLVLLIIIRADCFMPWEIIPGLFLSKHFSVLVI